MWVKSMQTTGNNVARTVGKEGLNVFYFISSVEVVNWKFLSSLRKLKSQND